MHVILSQKIDTMSSYSDDLFKTYHYPARYRNQLHVGDNFIYYQGNRYDKEQRYYFGTGIIGNIQTTDRESYYAELVQCRRFEKNVPIYLPDGGYVEQKDYASVRRSVNPPWQSSIRPLSKEAYDYITKMAGILEIQRSEEDTDSLKSVLKNAVKDFYVGGNNDAVLEIADIAKRIAHTLKLDRGLACGVTDIYETERPSRQNQSAVDKTMLFDYCKSMRMSYSYKPLLILAILDAGDKDGQITIENAVQFFRQFYRQRRKQGLKIEKGNCIYQRSEMSDESIAGKIIANPAKALSSSGYFYYDNDNAMFRFISELWTAFSDDDKEHIREICHTKLKKYYASK